MIRFQSSDAVFNTLPPMAHILGVSPDGIVPVQVEVGDVPELAGQPAAPAQPQHNQVPRQRHHA